MHRHGIWHLDLKPSNILVRGPVDLDVVQQIGKVRSYQVAVSDFGLSLRSSSDKQRRYSSCGTHGWCSPEQEPNLKVPATKVPVSEKSDVFSAGLLIMWLLRQEPPSLPSPSVDDWLELVANERHFDPLVIAPILRSMMCDLPVNRPSVSEAIRVLRHDMAPSIPFYEFSQRGEATDRVRTVRIMHKLWGSSSKIPLSLVQRIAQRQLDNEQSTHVLQILDALESFGELGPEDSLAVRLLRAKALRLQGSKNEALELLNDVHDSSVVFVEAQLQRLWCLLDLGRFDTAFSEMQNLRESVQNEAQLLEAVCAFRCCRFKDALRLFEDLYFRFSEISDRVDSVSLDLQHKIACCMLYVDRASKAKEQMRTVLDSAENYLGNEHPLSLKIRMNYASLFLEGEEKESVLRNVLQIAQMQRPDEFSLMANLVATTEVNRGRTPTRPNWQHTLGLLNDAVNKLQEWEIETPEYFRRMLAEFEEILAQMQTIVGDNLEHQYTLTARHAMAHCLAGFGNLQEAFDQLNLIAEVQTRVLGATHEDTAQTRKDIDKLFVKMTEAS
eukprot:ANDGO_01315.mRNA.1 hypothetical protein (macronuclear)